MYARAKDEQLQILADEIQPIADTPQMGEIITIKGDEREIKICDMLEHRKLRIEARKWLLAKLNPKKYGDKLGLEHSGEVNLNLAARLAKARERK